MMLDESAERVHPPPPSKRDHIVSQGHGPRATWLASFLGIVFFIALASLAAPLWIGSLLRWTREQFQLAATLTPTQAFHGAIMPMVWMLVLTILGALLGHACAHGRWIRMGAWKLRPRSSILRRFPSVLAGFLVSAATLATSVAFAWPWFDNISIWGDDSWIHVSWSALGMVSTTTLGAGVILMVAAIMQRFKARNAFESSIRLTSAQAREAAREAGEGRPRRKRQPRMFKRPAEHRS